MLQALAARSAYSGRPALVVAHPDDETIAAGGSLHLLPGLLLVHVTDGAPAAMDDARRHGFATQGEYAAAREGELRDALGRAGALPERHRLGLVDQEAIWHVREIAGALTRLFTRHGTDAVLTHSYEGGHPDHDAVALAVQIAAGGLGLPIFEFAGYHAGAGGGMVVQRFLPGPEETVIRLGARDAATKRAMLDGFRTQSGILSLFAADVERLRPAPRHDFTQPPHAGPLNYETWGWALTGAVWRARAREDLRCAA